MTTKMDISSTIFNNDYKKVIQQINDKNVNHIIDKKTKYTALHLAIKNNSNEIIDYLLSIGANYYAKTSDGKSCSDLALQFQCKHFFMNIDNDRSVLRDKLSCTQYENDNLVNNIASFKKEIEVLNNKNKKIIDDNRKLKITLELLNKENEKLKKENKNLDDENDDLFAEIRELNEKQEKSDEKINTLQDTLNTIKGENTKIKRKYDELDESYDGMLKKIRKE